VTVIGLASQSGVEGTVVDVDGTYQQWFAEHGWNAVAVRPDFYVYGTAVDVTSARVLAGELVSALCVETAMAERLARSR
jgi:3-(3-hydroxy-phenyl)propionate hydroxylase/flavoprotein hydroxylase